MLLPNIAKASIDQKKLADYVLNASHPEWRHKARVFLSALGLTAADAEWLGAYWKYRVGDWRIICDIQDRRIVVRVLRIGNRRDVYR